MLDLAVPPGELEVETTVVLRGELAERLVALCKNRMERPVDVMARAMEMVIERDLVSLVLSSTGSSFLRKVLQHRDELMNRVAVDRRRVERLRDSVVKMTQRAVSTEAKLKNREERLERNKAIAISDECKRKTEAKAVAMGMSCDALVVMILETVANDDMFDAVIDA